MVKRPDPDTHNSDESDVLSVSNGCALIKNFVGAGYDTIALDVVSDETAALYDQYLGRDELLIVMVLPSEEEVHTRLLSRPEYLSRGEPDELYRRQTAFRAYDLHLDNTAMTSEQAADWLLERWEAVSK